MVRETLDCRGMSCPQPVVETKKKLDSIAEGELAVLVDNNTARQNLLKLAESLRLYAASVEEKGEFTVVLSKSASPLEERGHAVRPVLLLTADTMGRGNDELGSLLMRSFLYALSEHDVLPGAVYLINSAVRLAARGSENLESLLKLSGNGVPVYSCGLCLDYFRLKDELAVGEVKCRKAQCGKRKQ